VQAHAACYRTGPRWSAIAVIDQPFVRSACASTQFSHVNIETGRHLSRNSDGVSPTGEVDLAGAGVSNERGQLCSSEGLARIAGGVRRVTVGSRKSSGGLRRARLVCSGSFGPGHNGPQMPRLVRYGGGGIASSELRDCVHNGRPDERVEASGRGPARYLFGRRSRSGSALPVPTARR
jgi:hypothetical protein